MTEHFIRSTENMHVWCGYCGRVTEHHVSNGHLGRCVNDHCKPRPLPRAVIPPESELPGIDHDITEVRPGHLKTAAHAVSLKDRVHIQALDGPDGTHMGDGSLPPKKGSGLRLQPGQKERKPK